MADRPRSLNEAFRQAFPGAGRFIVVRAPGRVNLLGGHTDYNDGYVLPAAVDRYLYVAAAPRGDGLIRAKSCALNLEARWNVSGGATRVPGWARSIHGVVVELLKKGAAPAGVDLLLWGDLPLAAGLSSSAALEVGAAWALCSLVGEEPDPVQTARLGQYVEHTYAGVRCGIMDQMTVALSREGTAMLLDCRSLERRHVPLGPLSLVVCHSGVKRELAASEYNRRRAQCERAVRRLRTWRNDVTSLRDVEPVDLQQALAHLTPVLARRVRHVVEETARVVEAAAALESGAILRFGQLVSESHRSLRDLYEVSSPELDLLVEIAQSVPGVQGCRLTGAGFGGAVIAVASSDGAAILAEKVRDVYPSQAGARPRVFLCSAAGAVREVDHATADEAWHRESVQSIAD